jgi:hypothetical protein
MPPLTIHYCKTIMRYCQTIIFLLLVLRGFLTYRFKIEVLIDYSSTIAIVEFLRRYTLNLIARLCLAASLAAHKVLFDTVQSFRSWNQGNLLAMTQVIFSPITNGQKLLTGILIRCKIVSHKQNYTAFTPKSQYKSH